jgi:hypothetical protein
MAILGVVVAILTLLTSVSACFFGKCYAREPDTEAADGTLNNVSRSRT